jgi:hypothetical protein
MSSIFWELLANFAKSFSTCCDQLTQNLGCVEPAYAMARLTATVCATRAVRTTPKTLPNGTTGVIVWLISSGSIPVGQVVPRLNRHVLVSVEVTLQTCLRPKLPVHHPFFASGAARTLTEPPRTRAHRITTTQSWRREIRRDACLRARSAEDKGGADRSYADRVTGP